MITREEKLFRKTILKKIKNNESISDLDLKTYHYYHNKWALKQLRTINNISITSIILSLTGIILLAAFYFE